MRLVARIMDWLFAAPPPVFICSECEIDARRCQCERFEPESV